MFKHLPVLLLLFTCCGVALPAIAQGKTMKESVLAFHSDVTLQHDGTLYVRETIKVRSTGKTIKHGIFREYPLAVCKPGGKAADFKITGVKRNGRTETYRSEEVSHGVRVYIGKKNVVLGPGDYTFLIAYRTRFPHGGGLDRDILRWDVTGHGWAFPIARASATITLPKKIVADTITVSATTGKVGKGKDYRASVNHHGAALFKTTKSLQPGEGLAIIVTFPKGFVKMPAPGKKPVAARRNA